MNGSEDSPSSGQTFTKPPRRKRRMHHDPSSLLRATIQEYGVYDKEVDAFKGRFVALFAFLEAWQRAAAHQERTQAHMVHAALDGDPDWTVSNRSPPRLPFGPVGRELSLEEELQVRLGRMTSLARALRCLCGREREQKAVLYKETADCKRRCLDLLNNLIQHFHKETGSLQNHLMAMERNVEDLEHDRRSLRMAYDEMVNHAAKTIEMLEADLEKAEQEVIDVTRELRSLKDAHLSLEEENAAFREEADDLHAEMTQLREKTKVLEGQAKASDMAREHFEILLEIALSKLRIYEEGDDPRKASQGQGRGKEGGPRVALSLKLLPETLGENYESRSFETTPKDGNAPKRLFPDSVSLTSFETTFSELSLPILDSPRNFSVSEDRISNVSQPGSLSGVSPSIPPRKKNKKRSFFSRPFNLKKSGSVESQLPKAVSSERLPTIKDERSHSKLSLVESRSAAGSRASLSEYYSAAESSTGRQDSVISVDYQLSNTEEERTEGATSKLSNLTDDDDEITVVKDFDFKDHERMRQQSEQPKETKLKQPKKVQRTSSFGALGKGGLVALAKDIEKRFRKKRRSKTADFSELNRIKDKEKPKTKDDNMF